MDYQYRRPDLVELTDSTADAILKGKNSNHHRDKFFPMMIDALRLKVGAEIGVDKGLFSEHLLSKSTLYKLYCIDPWIDNFGSDYKPNEYDPNGSNRMKEAMERLASYKDRIVPIRDFSVNAAKQIENNCLDFCYIDGDHSLEGIYTDIYTWIKKVRTGGIIAGHDYKDGPGSGMKNYWGEQLPYKIKTVVDNFCEQYGFKLNIVGGRILSWWFVKNI